MTEHERRTPIHDPTAERTSDQSTQSVGLNTERTGHGPGRQYEERQKERRQDEPDEEPGAASPHRDEQ